MSVVDGINAFEVIWWIGCGVVVSAKSLRAESPHRRRGLLSAVTLVLFGLSDVVELQTGAWWRPWWLLVWKGLCISILIACAIVHFRSQPERIDTSGDPDRGDDTHQV
ncbi:MAG: hypothetical protein H7062_18095 [Candidatus Saccharimonas sp.]|nr:hypothetical protein [Planctomycetaceae bacterium]